jgi:large subunit ribosomal protein L24
MAAKLKKGDRVMVLTGRDKGKTGEIVSVLPKDARAIVRGVNMVKLHRRATRESASGVFEREAAIALSNLAMIDPKSGRPTRVGFRILESGKKVRYAKRSGEILDR